MVQKIEKNVQQLKSAINDGVPIIIIILQKFPVIYKEVKSGSRRFAVIMDEYGIIGQVKRRPILKASWPSPIFLTCWKRGWDVRTTPNLQSNTCTEEAEGIPGSDRTKYAFMRVAWCYFWEIGLWFAGEICSRTNQGSLLFTGEAVDWDVHADDVLCVGYIGTVRRSVWHKWDQHDHISAEAREMGMGIPFVITLTARIPKAIAEILETHQDFAEQFNHIFEEMGNFPSF